MDFVHVVDIMNFKHNICLETLNLKDNVLIEEKLNLCFTFVAYHLLSMYLYHYFPFEFFNHFKLHKLNAFNYFKFHLHFFKHAGFWGFGEIGRAHV